MSPLVVICEAGTHCVRCRDREGGRRWREQLARAYELPAGGVDFACPYRRRWGWKRTRWNWPRGLGDIIAAITKALGIKQCGGCKRRQEALNQATAGCCGGG